MNAESQSLVPKAKTARDLAGTIAAAALARRKAAEGAARSLPKDSCYVLACNSNPREHIGILFAEGVNPKVDSEIHSGMWFSSYHDLEDPFFGGREQLVCSSCLVETGERMVLKVEMVRPSNPDLGSSFRVPPHFHRFLRVLGPQELRQFLGKEEPAQSPVKTEAAKGVKS